MEIKTESGVRDYTDLTEGSDIVLTFYTSLGELEVRLFPHEKSKSWIKVEVGEKGIILLEGIERYNEATGSCNGGIENYEELGGLSIIEAIDRGVFARPGGLMRCEVKSESNNKVSWAGREELRRIFDSRGELLGRKYYIEVH